MLEPETIDGIEHGMRLASNETVQERRKAYVQARQVDLKKLESVPRDRIIDCMIEHNPAYIRGLLEKWPTEILRETASYLLRASGTEKLRQNLFAGLAAQRAILLAHGDVGPTGDT